MFQLLLPNLSSFNLTAKRMSILNMNSSLMCTFACIHVMRNECCQRWKCDFILRMVAIIKTNNDNKGRIFNLQKRNVLAWKQRSYRCIWMSHRKQLLCYNVSYPKNIELIQWFRSNNRSDSEQIHTWKWTQEPFL